LQKLLAVLILLSIIIIYFIGISQGPGINISNNAQDWIEERLNKMTLEEKIGQMIMVGFDGKKVSRELKKLIEINKVGGVILFERNIESSRQLRELAGSIQELSGNIPLFIAVDQEGGIINRIDFAQTFPGNMALAATGDKLLAYKMGQAIGFELKSYGINMNLAPVLDINNNPYNPVIGLRSFGDDPALVGEMGAYVIKGFQEYISAVAKHFPGHGDTSVDSHFALPIISHSIERLNEVELRPFKEAIKAGVDGIMTAHIVYPTFEKEGIPATLSRRILTGLLRKDMDFDGLIITDDMEMAAITDNYGIEQAAVKSIAAGADIIMVCGYYDNQVKAFKAIKEAVDNEIISPHRIDESVERILRVKYRILNRKNEAGEMAPEEIKRIAEEISEKSITVLKNSDVIPLDNSIQDIFLILPHKGRYIEDEMRKRVQKLNVYYYSLNPEKSQKDQIIKETRSAGLIIIATYNAYTNPEQESLVKEIMALNKPVVIIPLGLPYDISLFKDSTCILTSYGYTRPSAQALIKVLFGEIEAKGKLPVKIDLLGKE